jgi:hypothetical protein
MLYILTLLLCSTALAGRRRGACRSNSRIARAEAQTHASIPAVVTQKPAATVAPQLQVPPPAASGQGGQLKGRLTWNSFEQGGDGGGASQCDEKFHSNTELIVALATGIFQDGKSCGKMVTITANGRSTNAKVVDQCDTPRDGCVPGTVDASKAVWDALGLDLDIGVLDVKYSIVA